MVRTQAWERLCDRQYSGSLTMGAFHSLLVEAGYREDDAGEMARQRGWERLSAGVVM